jgi:hypothetical protein
MKIRGISITALFALTLSLFVAMPAQARMTPNNSTSDATGSAVGLIVKYKPKIAAIANR